MILRRGYGLASIEHRVPISPSTVFDVASVSKQFTGLAVAMLVSQGKIKLSDDITTYIPELTGLGHRVTVAHLLHHTSGIRDWPGTLIVGGWRFDDAITFNQILTMAYNQRDLMFVPGSEYSYSNTNYNLLAEMIRRVTGNRFREWTDKQLFGPLGMTNTHFREHYTEVIPNRAYGYARGSDGNYHHMPNNLTALGSSSLFSTVEDFALWMINLDEARVGGRTAMTLARTRGTLNDGTTTDYAFGLIHGDRGGLPMLFHDGAWAGFSSLIVYFPEQKFGIAALSNGGPINVGDAVNKIAEIYLENELARAKDSVKAKPEVGPPVNVPRHVLGEYLGLYRFGPGSYMRIRLDGATLMAEATREKPLALSPISQREFSIAGPGDARILFQRGTAEKVEYLEYRGRRALKVDEASAPHPVQVGEYVGDYESEELGALYRVAAKGGALEMRHPRHGVIALSRLWRDDFGSSAPFMLSIEFQRDREGRVVGFVVNGNPRSRNLRFQKRR
jgi:CubicO group peptidase (beta-lactamase class C family)